MKKYQQLIEDYAGHIGTIKDLKRQKEEARQELKSLDPCDPEYVDLVETFDYLDRELQEAEMALDYAIKNEYAGVPFRKVRNQGISAFYREAGL